MFYLSFRVLEKDTQPIYYPTNYLKFETAKIRNVIERLKIKLLNHELRKELCFFNKKVLLFSKEFRL